MMCPRCAQENPPQAKFCLECGAPVDAAVGTGGSNAELLAEIGSLKRSLTEASEQQAATGEILRVISRAPSDLQPVLDAIAASAALVCDAYDAVVLLREGDGVRHAAHYGPINITYQHANLSRGSITDTAILDCEAVHVSDVLAAEHSFPLTAKAARAGRFRTALSVPLLRESQAIGALAIRRREIKPFTPQQIELLKTFADQAVIAIENARLVKELETRNAALTESLDQQTATSEILRVISRSPTELQPVLTAVAESAARVCWADDALIRLVDGDALRLVTHYGPLPDLDEIIPRDRGSATGRAIADRRAVHIHDLAAESEGEFPVGRSLQRRFHHRTVLAVPLLREGIAIGGILIRRQEVRPFADKQIALLQTFADQAVIAIENVRLFTELQEKTQELTRSVGQL